MTVSAETEAEEAGTREGEDDEESLFLPSAKQPSRITQDTKNSHEKKEAEEGEEDSVADREAIDGDDGEEGKAIHCFLCFDTIA